MIGKFYGKFIPGLSLLRKRSLPREKDGQEENMTDSSHILIVEDDDRLARLISAYLVREDFRVTVVDRGDTAPAAILDENPDLVILDLMLPGKDGLTICQEVRPHFAGFILMLTAREDDMDEVVGLEVGADDYVKKPVDPRVLLARIRAILRRKPPVDLSETPESEDAGESLPLVFGSLTIRITAFQVLLDGDAVTLTTTEFDLLLLLARNAGNILSRDFLHRELRGVDYDGLDRSVDMGVSRLRKKLGDDPKSPRRIKTVWGKGYLFVEEAW